MKKILIAAQIREADLFTIEHEPIRSIDLMERAAKAFTKQYCNRFSDSHPVKIFCGPGNNGGDGLAIARLLSKRNYEVQVYILQSDFSFSEDFILNEERLKKKNKIPVHYITDASFPPIQELDVVIDALWGNGLTRPLTGIAEALVKYINEHKSVTVAVDIPSGMFA
ncbi:MAG: NAD(P)H-hydrate epimerase, partial [Bacteroidota bacterium]